MPPRVLNAKEVGESQKLVDIARSRGITMSEILQYDLLINSCLSDNHHQNLINITL